MEHKRQVDAFKSIAILPHVFKQGFETLHWQWMVLLAAYHPVNQAGSLS